MKLVAVILVCFFARALAATRCEKISIKMCSNLGYNTTLMPNLMGHETQNEANLEIQAASSKDRVASSGLRWVIIPRHRLDPHRKLSAFNLVISLHSYEPFLSHTCSQHIKLLICSVFVPMCSEHVSRPIQACKSLCEHVKSDCLASLEQHGLKWPSELNCSRFPEAPELCMQQPSESAVSPNFVNPNDLKYNLTNCPPNTRARGTKCVPICKFKQLFKKEEVATFEIWIAIWSIICLIFTVVALLTFLIQPKRFRWPARPILYLTACGFVTSTIYLIRWIEGGYICSGELQDKPSESLSCVGISLILVFCDIVYSLWWCVFCFVWFLSAAKEWSTEAIEKISTRLHTSVWILSALPMLYILISNNIHVNAISGFCEIKNMSLIMFQLIFMVISTFLSVLTSLALKNVRKTLISAGRSPSKLEILFYRLLIISIGISLPHICYLLCQFYDSYNVALVKLVLRTISIIFSTLWVYSPKTFKTWNNLICSPFKSKSNSEIITEKPKKKALLKALIPKIFKTHPHLTVGPVTKV